MLSLTTGGYPTLFPAVKDMNTGFNVFAGRGKPTSAGRKGKNDKAIGPGTAVTTTFRLCTAVSAGKRRKKAEKD